MTRFDRTAHDKIKPEMVGMYDQAAGRYDQVGIKQSSDYAQLTIKQ